MKQEFKDLDFEEQIELLEQSVDEHGDPAYGRKWVTRFKKCHKDLPLLNEEIGVVFNLLTRKIPLLRAVKYNLEEYEKDKKLGTKYDDSVMELSICLEYYGDILILLTDEIRLLQKLRSNKKASRKEQRDILVECYQIGDGLMGQYDKSDDPWSDVPPEFRPPEFR